MLQIGDYVVDLDHGVFGEIVDIEGDVAFFAADGAAIVRRVSLDDLVPVDEYEKMED